MAYGAGGEVLKMNDDFAAGQGGEPAKCAVPLVEHRGGNHASGSALSTQNAADDLSAMRAAIRDRLDKKHWEIYCTRAGELIETQVNGKAVCRRYTQADALDEAAESVTLLAADTVIADAFERAARLLGVPSVWPAS
jgi:hypothetical protein